MTIYGPHQKINNAAPGAQSLAPMYIVYINSVTKISSNMCKILNKVKENSNLIDIIEIRSYRTHNLDKPIYSNNSVTLNPTGTAPLNSVFIHRIKTWGDIYNIPLIPEGRGRFLLARTVLKYIHHLYTTNFLLIKVNF